MAAALSRSSCWAVEIIRAPNTASSTTVTSSILVRINFSRSLRSMPLSPFFHWNNYF